MFIALVIVIYCITYCVNYYVNVNYYVKLLCKLNIVDSFFECIKKRLGIFKF